MTDGAANAGLDPGAETKGVDPRADSGGVRPDEHRVLGRFGAPTRVVAVATMVIAIALIPWIVGLGFTLPPRYDAGHWRLLWIGYDTAEVAVLAFVAWAAWSRRQILGAAALVSAVLLLCDAWFDIVTSWGHKDQWVTFATGVGAEIPLALFFLWLYRHLLLRSLAAYHALAGDGVVVGHLHAARFIAGVEEEPGRVP